MAPPEPILFHEDDLRFTVARSTIPGAGKGLFAKVILAAGERLEVIGPLIRADSVSDACTVYADQHKFRVGDLLLLPVGYGGMMNHSRTPNMCKIIEGDRIYLQALRTIQPGEELFYTYPDTALARFGLS